MGAGEERSRKKKERKKESGVQLMQGAAEIAIQQIW